MLQMLTCKCFKFFTNFNQRTVGCTVAYKKEHNQLHAQRLTRCRCVFDSCSHWCGSKYKVTVHLIRKNRTAGVKTKTVQGPNHGSYNALEVLFHKRYLSSLNQNWIRCKSSQPSLFSHCNPICPHLTSEIEFCWSVIRPLNQYYTWMKRGTEWMKKHPLFSGYNLPTTHTSHIAAFVWFKFFFFFFIYSAGRIYNNM